MDTVTCWSECILDLVQPTTDVFGEELRPEDDNVLSALLSFQTCEDKIRLEALDEIVSAISTVLQRQLASFISGDFVSPSTETLEATSCAPTNNMASERSLGLLDRMWRRAPNATPGFLSGKVKSKTNKTLVWLKKQPRHKVDHLVKFAVSVAREERHQVAIRRQTLEAEVGRRRKEVAQQRNRKNVTVLAKQINKALLEESLSETIVSDIAIFQRIQLLLRDRDSLCGQLILLNTDESEMYGRILSVDKKFAVRVSQWNLDQSESHSSDKTVSAGFIFASAHLGSLCFI